MSFDVSARTSIGCCRRLRITITRPFSHPCISGAETVLLNMHAHTHTGSIVYLCFCCSNTNMNMLYTHTHTNTQRRSRCSRDEAHPPTRSRRNARKIEPFPRTPYAKMKMSLESLTILAEAEPRSSRRVLFLSCAVTHARN